MQAGTPAVWWAMGTVCRKKRDKRRRVWYFDHRRGMCIKIIFEQASIELKVIICGAAYPVLVGIWQHAAVCYTIMMTRVWVVCQWWAAADQRINFIQ